MYQNDAQKVLTGEVRLSYCNLIQPRAPLSGQGDPKYSVTILIPKTDVATKADIDASIEAAARGARGKLGGRCASPLRFHRVGRRRYAQKRSAFRLGVQGGLGLDCLYKAETAGCRY